MIAHITEDGIFKTESVAEHTEKTEFLCRIKGERCGLAHIMSLCGILHDMGKNKQKFEEYICADKDERQRLKGTVPHATTGAKYIYDLFHSQHGNKKILTEMISYAVAAHHGLFDCVNREQTDIFSKKIREVDDYEEACKNAVSDYLNDYQIDGIFEKAVQEFDFVWVKLKRLLNTFKALIVSQNKQNEKNALYHCSFFLLASLQRLMLSVLIDADWEATSDFMDHIDTLSKQAGHSLPDIIREAEKNFDLFMKDKQLSVNISLLTEQENEIFSARNELQRECKEFAKYPSGIYCLPIPTGGGKTLSSLAYALEYCKQHPETERIIYVSPYISITEQNAEVFRQAIGHEEWILEHHSSVIRKEEKEDEDDGIKGVAKYDMNWEEPLICTTFVQFMNTLFSDKKESIRRMHRLVNAVVIIDEVQSMPLKCIHTFNYMINFLNTVCNTDIILCTATQPTLEEAACPLCYSEPKYMIKNVEYWFHKFERVKIRIPKTGEKYTMDSLGNEIIRQSQKQRSILVVLNTKSAVRSLYDLLKQQDVNVEYLTTNLCAEHRSDRIRFIKKILAEKKEHIVVVSTNLIEAGVDISFECVYRSMTGLDGLAQSAGRCNRNGEMDAGMVYLIELEGENTGTMTELLENARKMRQVLYEYQKSGGSDSLLLPQWMDRYYKSVYQGAADQMNFPIKEWDTNVVELLSVGFQLKTRADNIMNQAYQSAGQAYRVIDDDSFGIIVPYKKGREIIESIQNTSDPAEIKQYVKSAQRYTVNVRGNQLKKFDGLIQSVNETFSDIYMVAAPGAYREDCGITAEWETLII